MIHQRQLEERSRDAVAITSANHAPILQTITWFLLASMLLGVAIRMLTKVYLVHRLALDDILLAFAMVLALGQSVTLLCPQSEIWGQKISSLDSSSLEAGFMAMYAGNILYTASLFFAKCSILISVRAITPVRRHRYAIDALSSLVAVWFISSEFALAFECDTPRPWDIVKSGCHNKHAIYLYVGIMNIITDIGIIAAPAWIIASIKMSLAKRLQTIGLFSSRLFVVVAVIAQLAYLPGLTRSSDATFTSLPYAICTQVVQALSVLTVSIPHFQPFLRSLQSGLIFNDNVTRVSGGGYTKGTTATAGSSNWMRRSRAPQSQAAESVRGAKRQGPFTPDGGYMEIKAQKQNRSGVRMARGEYPLANLQPQQGNRAAGSEDNVIRAVK